MTRSHVLSLFRVLLLMIVTLIGCSSHLGGGEQLGEARQALACIQPAAADAAAAWQIGRTYAVGDLVEYHGQVYQCRIGHTSQATWAPDVSTTALWWSPSSCVTTDWQVQTDYNTGDLVVFQGRVYKAIQGHTSQS